VNTSCSRAAAQLIALAVDDPRVHRLGDLDEQDFPGEGDQCQVVFRRGRDQRRRQVFRIPAAQLDGEPAHADRGGLGNVPGL
jgi:hypothetical protein